MVAVAPQPDFARLLLMERDPLSLGCVLDPSRVKRHRHLEWLSRKFAAFAQKPLARSLILIPPRHGKTTTTCDWGLPWYAMKHAGKKAVFATHTQDFANERGVEVRNIIQNHGDELGVGICKGQNRMDEFTLTNGTELKFVGRGSGIMGRGIDFLDCDDLYASQEEADSDTVRNQVWSWFSGTLYTRLESGASVFIVMQRWHVADVAAMVQSKLDAIPWQVLRLPFYAEKDDPLGRAEGEILWPNRFTEAEILGMKQAAGAAGWLAKYQQAPIVDSMAAIRREWFRYYEDQGTFYEHQARALKSDCWRFITADLALSTKQDADKTSIGVWDVDRGRNLYLVDRFSGRIDAPTVEDVLRQMYQRYKPVFVGVEKAHYGMAILQQFQRDGIPIKELIADKDKAARAKYASIWMENGHVYFPANAPWLTEFEAELSAFPNAPHDDDVDMVGYACRIVMDNDYTPTREKVSEFPENTWGHLDEWVDRQNQKTESTVFSSYQTSRS